MAAMLASCSSDNLSVQTAVRQDDAQGLENAVSFEALSQRSLTRDGWAGSMDNNQLKEKGFGVFGYYTDLDKYDQTGTPNFMYNQQVSGPGWQYVPVKYWPNEHGSDAQSDDVDKVSFFAYAPYTENVPATGKVQTDSVGITGFTRNTAAGDPYVKYVGSLNPAQCVDLCWGVADPSEDVTWDIIQGGSQTIDKGKPWLNVQRPQKSLGQKMKLYFKHALAQLNVRIDADVNTDQPGGGDALDSKTKVFVRSITFSGFAMKGALNLNNEEAGVPNWKGYNCNNEPIVTEEYTIYDGMKDGKEGTGYVASNEKVTGLNPTIIQTKKWAESEEGVTKTAKNLFKGAVNDPIYVIPTGDDMSVTIVYDIETADEKLLSGTVSDNETNGVSIGNRISKTIKITGDGATAGQNLKLEAGKKYTIQLHLGLSQVEFDATVDEWDDAASAAGWAWLPENGRELSISGADAITAANNYAGTLTATVTPAEADQSVTWSSSNDNLLAVDADGNVTLAGGIPLAGEDVTITATSNADNSVKDTKTITVKPALGMFIASDGKAYLSAAAATTAGTTAKAWIAADGLAIALNADATLGNSDISWNDFKSQTSNFTTGPAEANISGGTWRWPNKADLDAINASINAGNYQGCPLEDGYYYWSAEEDDADFAWVLGFDVDFSDVSDLSKDGIYDYRVRAVFAY